MDYQKGKGYEQNIIKFWQYVRIRVCAIIAPLIAVLLSFGMAYSSKNPAAVYIVTYTYENIGYVDEDGIFISHYDGNDARQAASFEIKVN